MPLFQWLPPPLESKPESSQWLTRHWSPIPWTSTPTHLLHSFHSDPKGPLLLLQQSKSLHLLSIWLRTLFPPEIHMADCLIPWSLCFSVGPSLTILFKVCPPHIPCFSSPPYFSPKQSDHILTHYIIHMFIHLLSVSPARMGTPRGQGFLML